MTFPQFPEPCTAQIPLFRKNSKTLRLRSGQAIGHPIFEVSFKVSPNKVCPKLHVPDALLPHRGAGARLRE
jgi:hypothetical protein